MVMFLSTQTHTPFRGIKVWKVGSHTDRRYTYDIQLLVSTRPAVIVAYWLHVIQLSRNLIWSSLNFCPSELFFPRHTSLTSILISVYCRYTVLWARGSSHNGACAELTTGRAIEPPDQEITCVRFRLFQNRQRPLDDCMEVSVPGYIIVLLVLSGKVQQHLRPLSLWCQLASHARAAQSLCQVQVHMHMNIDRKDLNGVTFFDARERDFTLRPLFLSRQQAGRTNHFQQTRLLSQ